MGGDGHEFRISASTNGRRNPDRMRARSAVEDLPSARAIRHPGPPRPPVLRRRSLPSCARSWRFDGSRDLEGCSWPKWVALESYPRSPSRLFDQEEPIVLVINTPSATETVSDAPVARYAKAAGSWPLGESGPVWNERRSADLRHHVRGYRRCLAHRSSERPRPFVCGMARMMARWIAPIVAIRVSSSGLPAWPYRC